MSTTLATDPGETHEHRRAPPAPPPLHSPNSATNSSRAPFFNLGPSTSAALEQPPANGVNAMMAVDGSVIPRRRARRQRLLGSTAQTPRRFREDKDERHRHAVGYMAGPRRDYIPPLPTGMSKRSASPTRPSPGRRGRPPPRAPAPRGKPIRIVAHPDSPIAVRNLRTRSRSIPCAAPTATDINVSAPQSIGARGPTFAHGGRRQRPDDRQGQVQANRRHAFYGEAGNDTLHGRAGPRHRSTAGTGDDVIHGYTLGATISTAATATTGSRTERAPPPSTPGLGPQNCTVTLGEGAHEVHVGTGITRITAAF